MSNVTVFPAAGRTAPPPTPTPNYRPPRKGLIRAGLQVVFGEPNEARRAIHDASSHGAALFGVARVWAIVLLVAFSLAAMVALGLRPLTDVLGQYSKDGWQAVNLLEVIELAVIVAFVIGADLAMVTATTVIGDALQRGGTRGEVFGRVWGHATLVVLISVLEALTFGYLLVIVEGWNGGLAAGFVIGRSVMVPVVANYLATLKKRLPTQKDMERLLEMKLTEGLLAYIDQRVSLGEADFGQMMFLRMLLTDTTLDPRERNRQLVEAVSNLAPDAKRLRYEAEIAALRGRYEAEITSLRDQARAAADQAATMIPDRLVEAIFALVTGGKLPAWAEQMDPRLAGLDLSALAGSGRKPSRRNESKEPSTRAEAIRAYLAASGIEPVTTPAGRKGIWVRSSAIQSLTDGQLTGDTATALVRDLSKDSEGKATKVGNGYACPIERLLPELAQRRLLGEEAAIWWESLARFGANEEEELGTRAPTSRANTPRRLQAVG